LLQRPQQCQRLPTLTLQRGYLRDGSGVRVTQGGQRLGRGRHLFKLQPRLVHLRLQLAAACLGPGQLLDGSLRF
jgi:hypothetical protein